MTGDTPLDTFRGALPAERNVFGQQNVNSVEQLAEQVASDQAWLTSLNIQPADQTRIVTALSREMCQRADLLLPKPKAATVADVLFAAIVLGAAMSLFLGLMLLGTTP